jgi:hypothetical protein
MLNFSPLPEMTLLARRKVSLPPPASNHLPLHLPDQPKSPQQIWVAKALPNLFPRVASVLQLSGERALMMKMTMMCKYISPSSNLNS